MSSRTTRVMRGLAAASIALFLAALSHVAAGGDAPGQAGAALAAAFATIVCVALAGRRLSVPRLAIAVLISQFAFHLLFAVGTGAGSGLAVSTGQHHGRTVSTLVSLATAPDAVAGPIAGSASHGHDAALMWLSHLVAAVLTIVVLARGEQAVRRLVALGRSRLWEPVRLVVARAAGQRLALLVAALDSALLTAVIRNSSSRHRRRVFGETVAPALQQRMLTLGSLGHRGPPEGAVAHPSF